MTKHRAHFDALPFPVFAADAKGHLFYKNPAAMRALHPLRHGMQIRRLLLRGEMGLSDEIVYIKSSPSYISALALQDSHETLFLCLSRLQYPDGAAVAKRLRALLGESPEALFSLLPRGERKDAETPLRLYGELLRRVPQLPTLCERPHRPAWEVERFFEKLQGSFGALGFRVQRQREGEFLSANPVDMDRFDLLHLLGVVFYVAMKLSADGDILYALTSNPAEAMHRLTIKIRTEPLEKGLSVSEFFMRMAPECAAELILTGMAEQFFSHLTLEMTPDGIVFDSTLCYLAPAYPVQSIAGDGESEHILTLFFARLAAAVKEKSSYCRYFSAER